MRNATLVFGTMCALFAAASAHGAPVHFENPAGPGHFDWTDPTPDGSGALWLDVTVAATGQTGARVDGSSFQQNNFYDIGLQVLGDNGAGAGPSEVAVESPIPDPLGKAVSFLVGDAVGDPPGWGGSWAQDGRLTEFDGTSHFVDGIPSFMGVRFNLGDGYRYGYIGVIKDGLVYDAFAWGYETEVGVPVRIIPAPGAASLLGLCGLAAVRRQRRRG